MTRLPHWDAAVVFMVPWTGVDPRLALRIDAVMVRLNRRLA